MLAKARHILSQNMMHFVAFFDNNKQKNTTETWFLSSSEPDYFLFNTQPNFTCLNDSEDSILCLISRSVTEENAKMTVFQHIEHNIFHFYLL